MVGLNLPLKGGALNRAHFDQLVESRRWLTSNDTTDVESIWAWAQSTGATPDAVDDKLFALLDRGGANDRNECRA